MPSQAWLASEPHHCEEKREFNTHPFALVLNAGEGHGVPMLSQFHLASAEQVTSLMLSAPIRLLTS